MPHQENSKSVNQKFSDMNIGQNGRQMDEATMRFMYNQFDSTDENSYPAMKVEKNDSPLLHKNFYNEFIDFLQPLKNHIK